MLKLSWQKFLYRLLVVIVLIQVCFCLYLFINFQEPRLTIITATTSHKVLKDCGFDLKVPTNCENQDHFDFRTGRQFSQRGNYTVLANYIEASESVSYKKSITIATHATVDYLKYIDSLVHFWAGPISVAVFAPGTDFSRTLAHISFLRNCISNGPKVQARVTFHIIFPLSNLPIIDPAENLFDMGLPDLNCSEGLPNSSDFRRNKKLKFPINLARNVAREGATTYFVLVNDIELFPQPPELIPKFFKLINRMEAITPGFLKRRQVFVLPPFEVRSQIQLNDIPRNKSTLLEMIDTGQANKFHFYSCDICHRLPNRLEWYDFVSPNPSLRNELNIFYTSNYISKFAWEPFYIGTHSDPPFDERIHREHSLNKVIQANALCHLGYKFHVLDNAFLVHRPGIKVANKETFDYAGKALGYQILRSKVRPLQKALYGQSTKCF